MAILSRSLGRRRDWPQLENNTAPSAIAGAGADWEKIVFILPNLALNATPGSAGILPLNSVVVRTCHVTAEAAVTGAATNNCSVALRQYRAGTVVSQVNTTSATTIVASTMAVTPASMQNIQLNQILRISGGTGAAETVVVTAITGTTFTATFVNGHSGAYTIVCTNIASILFASTINAAAFTPLQLATGTASNGMTFIPGVALQGGDVLTMQRQSFGTGLATPNVEVQIEWVPAGIGS